MKYQRIIGAIAGGLIVLSAFLPWVMVGEELVFSGFNNSEGVTEGVIVLILGLLIIACSFIGKDWSNLVAALAGGYLILKVIGIIKVVADFNLGNPDLFSAGNGIILLLIMSILAALNGLLGILRNTRGNVN